MQGTMMDYPLTLPAMLERAGKLFGGVEMVARRPDRSLHRSTYAQFYRRARALAESLAQAGLRRGDRVATLLWNHHVHLEAYFGVPAAGGVLHTLNVRLHADELTYIVNHAEDRFLIVEDSLLPLYESFRERVALERVFVAPLSGKAVPGPYHDYEQFIAQAGGDFAYPQLEENEAAAMCYTSGTTGKPKGVVYSHRALALHSLCVGLADTWALSQRDVVLPACSMFHANAWGIPYAATLLGSKQVFPARHLDAESLLELFEQEQVTFSSGVPTIWLAVVDALEKSPGRWKLAPGLRIAVAGSAAPESMIRRFDRQGIRIIHLWGMTETTPVATVCNLKRSIEEWPEDRKYQVRARQGLPVPFVEVRAAAEDQECAAELPWDDQSLGELQVRGPWIAGAYYNFPEGSERWTADGWFRTGDVVTLDAEGYVKIADRSKDLVKSGGEWISSVDLENALMGHPAVSEAAVVAVPHPKWQERPLAVVVLKDGASVTPEELRLFLGSRFARWQLPDAFVFTDQIPKTSVGKFLKSQLREQFKGWCWER